MTKGILDGEPAQTSPGHTVGSASIWTALSLASLTVASVTAIVFAIRLSFVIIRGEYSDSISEGPPIYGIWKVHHSCSLYEWPNRDQFSVTLYNYAFYYFYATILKLLGASDVRILCYGRLLTVLFVGLGSLVSYRIMTIAAGCRCLDLWKRLFLASVAFVAWFGSWTSTWFALSVRPDFAALMLAHFAWLVYIRSTKDGESWRYALSSLLFYLAWSFKQSAVGLLGGVLIHVILWNRRPVHILYLVGPCGGLILATLYWGGEIYRANVLVAPSIAPLGFGWGRPGSVLRSIAVSPFTWLFPLLLLLWSIIRIVRTRRILKDPIQGLVAESAANPEVPLANLTIPSFVAVAWCSFALFRDGADRNTLLEGYIALTTCAAVLLVRSLGALMTANRLWGALVFMLVLGTGVFPAAQLVLFNQLGDLTVGSAERHQRDEAFARFLASLPKPLFIDHSIYGQPWHATDNKYPACVVDYMFHIQAQKKGWIEGGGYEGLVRRHAFRCLLLKEGPVSRETALAAGYRPVPFPSGVDSLGFELFLAPWEGGGAHPTPE